MSLPTIYNIHRTLIVSVYHPIRAKVIPPGTGLAQDGTQSVWSMHKNKLAD